MIVRVLGRGQYHLDHSDLPTVEKADDAIEAALASGDPAAFSAALTELIATIERVATPVTDDEFVTSDVIVPDDDTTLEEASAYLYDPGDGLIPG